MVYYNVIWIHIFLLVTIYKMYVDAASDMRFPAKSFSNTLLAGRRVTCHKDHDERKLYPNDAYKCHNISIDGLRLRNLDIKSYSRAEDSDPNKSYEPKNNIAALCNEMLKEHGVSKSLWTVYAKDVSNQLTHKERLIFVKTRTGFSWEETTRGVGYIKTITCMVDDR